MKQVLNTTGFYLPKSKGENGVAAGAPVVGVRGRYGPLASTVH